MDIYKESLIYHKQGQPGKLSIETTKPLDTQKDLSLAYSPGVAEPCRKIKENKDNAYLYTNKSNLVAVISNGTAVLGLGNIGALASKPVMEGKAALFKKFANINSIDIEINEQDPKKIVEIIKAISPSFGGINLEDIKAPDCFEVEKELKKTLDIPVMHDDQHGTAIVVAAGLLNSSEIANKELNKCKTVINGAGAGALAVADLLIKIGVLKENLIILDSKGVLNNNRNDLNIYKKKFVNSYFDDISTLNEAIIDADVFIGLGVGNILNSSMVKKMNVNPIVFALSNPDPEISYNEAIESRDDIIVATGRSDYPNQINNILCFPFLFRGALDVFSSVINDQMKLSMVKAISQLAKERVPNDIKKIYNNTNLEFGKYYILPKPFDKRLLYYLCPRVAKASIESGASKIKKFDLDQYTHTLELSV